MSLLCRVKCKLGVTTDCYEALNIYVAHQYLLLNIKGEKFG